MGEGRWANEMGEGGQGTGVFWEQGNKGFLGTGEQGDFWEQGNKGFLRTGEQGFFEDREQGIFRNRGTRGEYSLLIFEMMFFIV